MLDVMERCFPERFTAWQPKLKEMVPSLGVELSTEPKLFEEVWARGTEILKLDEPNDFDIVTQDAALKVWDQFSQATFLALVVIYSGYRILKKGS